MKITKELLRKCKSQPNKDTKIISQIVEKIKNLNLKSHNLISPCLLNDSNQLHLKYKSKLSSTQ
jgi:hypothetical protein